jgi:hypothetical protein
LVRPGLVGPQLYLILYLHADASCFVSTSGCQIYPDVRGYGAVSSRYGTFRGCSQLLIPSISYLENGIAYQIPSLPVPVSHLKPRIGLNPAATCSGLPSCMQMPRGMLGCHREILGFDPESVLHWIFPSWVIPQHASHSFNRARWSEKVGITTRVGLPYFTGPVLCLHAVATNIAWLFTRELPATKPCLVLHWAPLRLVVLSQHATSCKPTL